MANRLKMAVVDSIYTLLERGYSQRWIARTLGIDRETVRRYAELARSKPAGAPPGSDPAMTRTYGAGIDSNPARAPSGSTDADPPGDSNAATAPPGSSGSIPPGETCGISKPAGAPPGSESPSGPVQTSTCEPFRDLILAKLEQGLSATVIWQDLVAEHDFPATSPDTAAAGQPSGHPGQMIPPLPHCLAFEGRALTSTGGEPSSDRASGA